MPPLASATPPLAFTLLKGTSALQVERYDPFGNKWIMMAPLRDGVSNAAVVSAKLKLFVFGGTNIHRDKASKVGLFHSCTSWMSGFCAAA